jgi:hypothetical protein
MYPLQAWRRVYKAMTQGKTVADLKGLVATVVITGSIVPQYSECHENMRSYNEVQVGLRNVEYKKFYGVLVEAARDDVVKHALQNNYDWILQIDADATFPQDTLHRLLERAYVDAPDCGVVGAYCQLKPQPHMPTIDTGTGTWEEHYPGEGLLPVIRTGAHCFLAKTWVFQKIGRAPWFRTRLAQRPVQAFREVDGFMRQRLDGENPLTEHPEWETGLHEAVAASRDSNEAVVGEDSSFFDRCRAHNVSLFVDCDLPTGHMGQQLINPALFKEQVDRNRRLQRLALGVG